MGDRPAFSGLANAFPKGRSGAQSSQIPSEQRSRSGLQMMTLPQSMPLRDLKGQ